MYKAASRLSRQTGLQKGLDDSANRSSRARCPTALMAALRDGGGASRAGCQADKAEQGGGGGGRCEGEHEATGAMDRQGKRGDKAAMEALLAADASLLSHKARGIGHTAMHWAAAGGDKNLYAMALEHEGRRQLPQQFGGDALVHGGEQRAGYFVEWLLTRGADGSLVNDDGNTAADMAKKKNRPDLATTIERLRPTAAAGRRHSDAAGAKKEDQHAKNTADSRHVCGARGGGGLSRGRECEAESRFFFDPRETLAPHTHTPMHTRLPRTTTPDTTQFFFSPNAHPRPAGVARYPQGGSRATGRRRPPPPRSPGGSACSRATRQIKRVRIESQAPDLTSPCPGRTELSRASPDQQASRSGKGRQWCRCLRF